MPVCLSLGWVGLSRLFIHVYDYDTTRVTYLIHGVPQFRFGEETYVHLHSLEKQTSKQLSLSYSLAIQIRKTMANKKLCVYLGYMLKRFSPPVALYLSSLLKYHKRYHSQRGSLEWLIIVGQCGSSGFLGYKCPVHRMSYDLLFEVCRDLPKKRHEGDRCGALRYDCKLD